jgi:hypothetical protein
MSTPDSSASATPKTDNYLRQGREWVPLGIFERLERECAQLREALAAAALRASRTSAMLAGSPDTITANAATDHWLRQEPIYPLVSAAPTQRF